MAKRKAQSEKQVNIGIGDIRDVSGEVNIAGGNIGYTVEQVSVLLTKITSTFQLKSFDGRCPYKGLDVFEEEDAELFFGRARLVEDLIGRVKESRTVFITGPSGSGKSSLVRAGLIHALKQGAIKNLHSEHWLYETMKPGREPIKDLALAFSRLKSPELANYFRAHARETNILNECAESVLSGRKDQRFVLFVDQFEEVFTQISQEEERLAFLNMLAHAGIVENGRVIVLFAMRSDFVSNCATYPALNEMLSQQFRQIGAMQPEELVSAIALPAKHVGLPIEDELIARIINDMKGEPGALPLMQFALKDLFDSQKEKGGLIALTLEDYLQHGGIQKSLERHADYSFAKLSEREQGLARSIFSGLIEIGRGTEDTRRTALFDELVPANTKPEDVLATVEKLADARLIITDEQAGKETVTISHEKLIDAWPWLKKLVNENRDVIALQNEIASDAKEWDDRKRDSSYLYTGARLINAREQLQLRKLALSGLAQEFVLVSHARQRRGQVALITGVSSIIALLVLAVVIVSHLSSANEQQSNLNATQASEKGQLAKQNAEIASTAQANANIALARQLVAQAQSINAMRSSNQTMAVLLAAESINIYPSSEAAQVLMNNNFAGQSIGGMTHNDFVRSVGFSPDGKYVVSGSQDYTARVWEASTGTEIARMTHDDWVTSVAFSPDGKYVVSGSKDYTARVWETVTGKEVARMTQNDFVWSVAFSPDGKYVASGSQDYTARVWEPSTGREVARMTHNDFVRSVVFSPDGKYVLSGSQDYTTRVWEPSTGREVARMTQNGFVWSVAFSPDGKYVVSGSDDKTARVWEASIGTEIARMIHDDAVNSVSFSLDGKYALSGSDDNTARLWEISTGKEITRMTHDEVVWSAVFSPDGKYVISGSNDKTARIWEILTGKEVARMTHDDWVTSVAFSPDGKYAVSGSKDAAVRVWEISTGKEVARMTHDDWVTSVAFSPDGKYVVSGSKDASTRIWEASTGKEVARMTQNDFVWSVAFSPDGKYVASGSKDFTARVWEASTGKEVARMTHDDGVSAVAFNPDGRYVVSGSADNTARVWEASTGKEVVRMTYDSVVTSVAFSLDGKYIVSGSYDKTARIWLWQPNDLIANACASLPRNLTRAEWKQYIGDVLPYQAICPNLPIEPEPMPIP